MNLRSRQLAVGLALPLTVLLYMVAQHVGDTLDATMRRVDSLADANAALAARVTQLEAVMSAAPASTANTANTAGTAGSSGALPVNTYYKDTNLVYTDEVLHEPPASLALNVLDNMRVSGNIYLSGCLVYQTSGVLINLCELTRVLTNLQGCSSGSCIHGAFNADCNCVCFDGWEGIDCAQSTCAGAGVWNTNTLACECQNNMDPAYYCASPRCVHGSITVDNVCECIDAFSGPNCDIPVVNCITSCMGQCDSYGRCVCGHLQYGPLCQYNCSAAGVRDGKCFVKQTNLGTDLCAEFDSTLICACGGGYNLLSPTVTTRIGICVGCSAADTEYMNMATCCAPDAACVPKHVCTTEACCLAQTNATCAQMGCHLCAVDDTTAYCSLHVSTTYSCVTDTRPPVTWYASTLDCVAESSNPLCDELPRREYLDIYAWPASLSYKRDAVNMREWSSLQLTGGATLQQTFAIKALASPFDCDAGTYYVGVTGILPYTGAALLGVTCGAPTPFWLGVNPSKSLLQPPTVGLYFTDEDGLIKCATDIIQPDNLFASFTMASDTVDRYQSLGVPVGDSFAQCASVDMNGTAFMLGSSYWVMDTTRNLLLLPEDSAPLPVRLVQLTDT